MDTTRETLTTHQKALHVNLDPLRYGTFAEIGAGQEVVRWFFQAGGASGTIAKSMSAYDMTVSDAIYGPAERYVCRSRLQAMLDYEHNLNLSRLRESRGDSTAFFTFADTVSARSFRSTRECHGWMGVKFQSHPRDQDSQIIIHVRMLDNENARQQEALGVVGVNLLYGAFNLFHQPERLLSSLLDGLSPDRIEIDMIEFSGIEFRHVDNRVMALRLVEHGMSRAAMFSATGQILQPSEVLHKRPALIERGSFRPVTLVNLDMLRCATRQFADEADVDPERIVSLMEITMSNLMDRGEIDLNDFLARADALAAAGMTVLISDFQEYYRLADYIYHYNEAPIGITMSAQTLGQLFDEAFYDHLPGGILEAFGHLFKKHLRLYVHPFQSDLHDPMLTADNVEVANHLQQLYRHLIDTGRIKPLNDFNRDFLHIFASDILRKIKERDPSWEDMVPAEVAAVIKARSFFGHRPTL